MVIAVRTESGPEGLTIVKSAETDRERLRLANEAELLARAAHPGVVEIVSITADELRLRHAGTPLTHLLPLPADHAAAVVCAVAEVLDAIHGAGVAHGQIDADHVVVDDGGRPRVCGFGKATAIGDRRAEPATDDIADLGGLFDRLLDEAAHIPWTPANAGHRHRTRRKQARELFRNVAGMAQRSDPRQRLSPHQIANAIREALPSLQLPTPSPRASDGDGLPIPAVRDLDATVDVASDGGWSTAELQMLAAEASAEEAAFDAGRSAGFDGGTESDSVPQPTGPPPRAASPPARASVQPVEPKPVPEPKPAPDPEPAPMPPPEPEPVPRPEPAPRPVPEPEPEPQPVPARDRDPDVDAGPSYDYDHEDDEYEDEEDLARAYASRDGRPSDDGPAVETEADARARLEKALASGPPPITIRESSLNPQRRRRREPPEPEPTDNRRRIGIAMLVVCVAGLIIAPLAVIIVQAFGDDAPDQAASQNTQPSTTLPGTPSTWAEDCDLPALTGPDVNEDGCPEMITVNGRNVQVGNVPIAFGEDGDIVAVGDTDCDGVMTPYLLRPSTGQVFAWSQWPLDAPVDVRATDVVPGGTGLERRDGDLCDVIVVTGAGETVVAGTP